MSNALSNLTSLISTTTYSLFSLHLASLASLINSPRCFKDFLSMNFTLSSSFGSNINVSTSDSNSNNGTIYSSENMTNSSVENTFTSSMSELSTGLRFTRFNNPLISYDYKCGNYLGI